MVWLFNIIFYCFKLSFIYKGNADNLILENLASNLSIDGLDNGLNNIETYLQLSKSLVFIIISLIIINLLI